MHTQQAKSHSPNTASATKTVEPTQKVAHSAAASTRLPAWTSAWGDQPPATLIQRAPLDGNTDSTTPESTPTPATTTPKAASTSATPPPEATSEMSSPAFIVEDSAEQLAPGQMKKSDFLAQLRPAVCTTAEEALKGTIWSAVGCPWIDHWFGYYNNRDSQQIERALRRYAPETARVTTASDYIPIICERVNRDIRQWSTTGEIPSLPEGIDAPDMGIMGVAGSIASGIASIASGVESVASGIASVGSSIASGVGSVLSGIGSLFSKGREGGAREAANPQVIQGQLGSGRSLDGGVRSQMEPAFGTNFSHVRIHTDATAAGLSESLNARAFTIGRDVAFGPGEYRPGTLIGDALIAHELAHVVQQGSISPSAEPLQKGGTEYNALEEDADMSAVRAMVSMWNGTKGLMTNIPQNAMPTMRSGLKLQRCPGTPKQPTTVPTSKQPTIARPPTTIPNWGASVHTANSTSDPTQRRNALVALIKQALSGTGIQVTEGPKPAGGTGKLGEVSPKDYQEAPILNFDIDLNRRTGRSNVEREPTDLSNNNGYFFTSGSTAYAIIGPQVIEEESPDYIRMYAEHELYHTRQHVGVGGSFADQELETWTNDFRNNFHLFYRYRQGWAPLIGYYQQANKNARQIALNALVDYYNNPPAPATPEQGSKQEFTQRLKRVFAKWLRRQLKNSNTSSKSLVQDIEGRLHLGSSPDPHEAESSSEPNSP